MLVLAAVYNTNHMRSLVPGTRFRELLVRTIRFLRKLAPISPTCACDCGILEKFNNYLFGVGEELESVYRNEGIEAMRMSTSFGVES
jgi:hypothetical protein